MNGKAVDKNLLDRMSNRLSVLGHGDGPTRHWVLGIVYGYPDCCIEFFVNEWDDITWHDEKKYAEYIMSLPASVGYIPCPKCKEELKEKGNGGAKRGRKTRDKSRM